MIGENTNRNMYEAFLGEAKAHFRLMAFSRQADREGYPDVARLFRAVAAAEAVHATAHLKRLGETVTSTTEENLKSARSSELTVRESYYPRFVREAEEEGDRRSATFFSWVRDVEESHAELYKSATACLLRDEPCRYYVCKVCGFVAEGDPVRPCAICGAAGDVWMPIE